MRKTNLFWAALLACVFIPLSASADPVIQEGYYKVKWGYENEWNALFKKNHWPILKALEEEGYILELSASEPKLHGTEEGRWTARVTIVFRDEETALISGEFVDKFNEISNRLYPKRKQFEAEEKRRFEILESHWDVLVSPIDFDAAE